MSFTTAQAGQVREYVRGLGKRVSGAAQTTKPDYNKIHSLKYGPGGTSTGPAPIQPGPAPIQPDYNKIHSLKYGPGGTSGTLTGPAPIQPDYNRIWDVKYGSGGTSDPNAPPSPGQIEAQRAQEQFDNAMKIRETSLSELERLQKQLSGEVPFAQQIEMQNQTARALAGAQSQAAARRGMNRGLAAKMAADSLANIRGRGQEAYAQAGLEAYQQGLGEFQDSAGRLASQDASAFAGLTQGALSDQQRQYLEAQRERQRQMALALQNSSNYWSKQAAMAGQPEKPGVGEMVTRAVTSLAPLALLAG